MRPLKLTISAFGPYASVQKIDFTSLREQIFVISGPTGAGKTTIFDAISYALFGEASGSSRDRDDLRSDFADPDTETFVELEFELRGLTYTIKRSPQQEQKKQRGEGYTIRNADAELVMPEGTLITKVANVDEKINHILGINKSQFKQIVMLPQGEFRKLLEADSNERELIFRKIFGTDGFLQIQRRLEDESKELYKTVHDIRTQIDTHIKHFDVGSCIELEAARQSKNVNIDLFIAGVRQLQERDSGELNTLKARLEQIAVTQGVLKEDMAKASEINKKLAEKERLQVEVATLAGQSENLKQKTTLLEYARKALMVAEVDHQLEIVGKSIETKKAELITARENCEKWREDFAQKEQHFLDAKNLEPERKKREVELSLLDTMLQKVLHYEKTLKLKETARVKSEEITLLLDKSQKALALAKNSCKEQEEVLKEVYTAEADSLRLEKSISDNKKLLNELDTIKKLIEAYLKQEEEYRLEAEKFEAFDTDYVNTRSRLEQLEDNYIRGQAGLLAKRLEDNLPCPVCGSMDHPSPARMPDNIPEEEHLKQRKKEFSELTEVRTGKLSILSEINGSVEGKKLEIQNRIAGLEEERFSADEGMETLHEKICTRGAGLKAQTLELMAKYKEKQRLVSQKQSMEDEYKKTQNGITALEETINKRMAEKSTAAEEFTGLTAQITSIEKEIPENLRTASKLNASIAELKNTLEEMNKKYKKAEQEREQGKILLEKAEKEVAVKASSLEDGIKDKSRLEELLKDKLLEHQFESYSHYKQLVKSQVEINSLQEEISTYLQNLKSKKDFLDRLQKETHGMELQDVEALNEKYKLAATEQAQVQNIYNVVFSRHSNNSRTLKQLEAILVKLAQLEDKYRVIGKLERVAKGDNPQRITFERYVLAAYFDEIIEAANLRLAKMTGSRYLLKRKEDKSKGRAQQGLELEVFDNYTGKARHVKTLSGGEGFKASLSLALGLADVVQSYSGGISLDTLFVDEGFGSLDPESLDSAIQCLVDIQKTGRLVGVISHVPELKERIKCVLEIFSQKEGSFAKLVV